MTRKAIQGSIIERKKEIENLIKKQWSRKDIVQYSAKKWNLKTRIVDEYINSIKKNMVKAIEKHTLITVESILREIEDIQSLSREAEDFRTALKSIIEKAKIAGVYTEGLKLIKDVQDLTIEEIDELLKEKSKKP